MDYRELARAEGVERPFDILLAAGSEIRANVAQQLGIELGQPASPEAAAWTIIGANRKGLQARAHPYWRSGLPLRNYTWREILQYVAKERKIKEVAGLSEEGLETAITEQYVDECMAKLTDAERAELGELDGYLPAVFDMLKQQGKSPKVMRWVLSGVLTEVEKAGFRAYINVVKGTAFLNRKLGSKIAMRTASQSLKLVLRAANVAMWAWLAHDVADAVLGRSPGKLVPAVTQLLMAANLQDVTAAVEEWASDRRDVIFVHGLGGEGGGDLESALTEEAAKREIHFHVLRWGAGSFPVEVGKTITKSLVELLVDRNPVRTVGQLARTIASAPKGAWDRALVEGAAASERLRRQLIDRPPKARVSLIGFSLGARVVLNALAGNAAATACVDRIVLVGAAVPRAAVAALPECVRDGRTTVNFYSHVDTTLKGLYPAMGEIPDPVGAVGAQTPGVLDIEVERGHLDYAALAQRILELALESPA